MTAVGKPANWSKSVVRLGAYVHTSFAGFSPDFTMIAVVGDEEGFGHVVIENMVAQSVDGEVHADYNPADR